MAEVKPLCLGFQVIWSTSPNWSPGAFLKSWWKNTSGPKTRQLPSQTSYYQCWSWSQRKERRQQSVSGTPGLTHRGFDPMPQHYTPVYSIAYTHPAAPSQSRFFPCSFSVWSSSFKASKILDKPNPFCWVCLCDSMGALLSQWCRLCFGLRQRLTRTRSFPWVSSLIRTVCYGWELTSAQMCSVS